MIGSLAAQAVAQGDRAAAFTAIRSVSQMPDISYARLESSAGLLAETGGGARLLRDAAISGDGRMSLWSALTTGSIQVSAPVLAEGRAVGSITLFSRTPELRSRVLATVLTSLVGAVVAVFAGLLVATRMARRISQPVVQLASLVRQVHETHDYTAPAPIQAEGEVADLVEGFDALLAGIRERDARISAHVEGLEAEVETRTADLVVARDAADQANAAKSDFLAVMSHEIRTPLNGILALSEMLAGSDLPARQQRYASVIAKSGHSLLSIINDILDFSKVEAGKMELETVEVDLTEVAEDVASLFSEKAASKGLDLAVFVDPAIGAVLADPVRLRQVIGNLVNNAIKFTEHGGVLIAIHARDGGVRIAIEDTGPGIPEDTLPRLFDAFSQADQSTSRRYGGTGLGLAICDRLVRSMGGVWQLSSVVGVGSVFAFDAPLTRVADEREAPMFPEPWSVRLAGLGPQTLRSVRAYLEAFGLSVAETGRGSIVGPAEEGGGPHVVLCRDEAEATMVLAGRPDSCAVVAPLRRADLVAVLGQMAEGRQPHLAHAVATAAEGTTFPGARVLVVDDSEVNREVAGEALARLGVDVEMAADGLEAVAALRLKAFDLVLMDGSMPGLDGFDATRQIRAEEAETGRPRATVIALTAHVVGSGADAWRACGMDGVIHKPFVIADLVRALDRHCGAFARIGARGAVVEARAVTGPQDDDLFDPVIRGDLLAMVADGRRAFVERVQALYAENAPLRLSEAVQAIQDADLDALARAAHALKSMSLSLGAAAVARAASALETAARAGERPSPTALLSLGELVNRTISRMAEDLAPAEPSAPPMTIVERVRAAIAAGHLNLVYQPLVDRLGAPAGKVEALVRWTDPIEGRIGPDIFIPALEAASGIEVLTDFVLATALAEMKDGDLIVSVNASASEFRKADFVDRLLAAVAKADYPASRLEIEVTETAMLDVAAAGRTIDALRGHGFGVALDDFGAGFTSLHALRELKFTTLKIDRSFVDRCSDDTASAAIIHAVIGVGRALGMKVVCEGIETVRQADFLRVAGVHYMQGFHFHRPMDIEALQRIHQKAA
ncbi:EAL domain-containing protein [Brevundimonas sp. LM2]|uniref:EAL domain-containing protein n=1 Tax=Brevundimonas sp. LM2 TaxID=1938605 RepID=UPI0009867AA1|nr:EAL domain-containing protein [Brevundimonas sp. LM2]